ncbi:Stem-specific protein TSJT1 [Linum perenne]
MGYVRPEDNINHLQQMMLCGLDDMYCMFLGRLNNLCSLNRQYGVTSKCSNEGMLVIEAYRTLRDRGPYPADQVVKDFEGSFAFVVYDTKAGVVFVALVISYLARTRYLIL